MRALIAAYVLSVGVAMRSPTNTDPTASSMSFQDMWPSWQPYATDVATREISAVLKKRFKFVMRTSTMKVPLDGSACIANRHDKRGEQTVKVSVELSLEGCMKSCMEEKTCWGIGFSPQSCAIWKTDWQSSPMPLFQPFTFTPFEEKWECYRHLPDSEDEEGKEETEKEKEKDKPKEEEQSEEVEEKIFDLDQERKDLEERKGKEERREKNNDEMTLELEQKRKELEEQRKQLDKERSELEEKRSEEALKRQEEDERVDLEQKCQELEQNKKRKEKEEKEEKEEEEVERKRIEIEEKEAKEAEEVERKRIEAEEKEAKETEEAERERIEAEEIRKRLADANAKSGKLQVSLKWDGTDDLDLLVTPPGAATIYFRHRESGGGRLDVDANANANATTSKPIENVFFEKPNPGKYHVIVNCYVKRVSEKVRWILSVNSGDAQLVWKEGVFSSIDQADFTFFNYEVAVK